MVLSGHLGARRLVAELPSAQGLPHAPSTGLSHTRKSVARAVSWGLTPPLALVYHVHGDRGPCRASPLGRRSRRSAARSRSYSSSSSHTSSAALASGPSGTDAVSSSSRITCDYMRRVARWSASTLSLCSRDRRIVTMPAYTLLTMIASLQCASTPNVAYMRATIYHLVQRRPIAEGRAIVRPEASRLRSQAVARPLASHLVAGAIPGSVSLPGWRSIVLQATAERSQRQAILCESRRMIRNPGRGIARMSSPSPVVCPPGYGPCAPARCPRRPAPGSAAARPRSSAP